VHGEEAYGLARTGQSICVVADALVFELFVDDEPLFVPTARLREYARVLDIRNGVLQRDLVWSTAAGKHVAVNSCRLVSLEHRHLVAVAYEVSVDGLSPVSVVSRTINRMDQPRSQRPERPRGAAEEPDVLVQQAMGHEHDTSTPRVSQAPGDVADAAVRRCLSLNLRHPEIVRGS
jgi:alpha,alpha-trehalose phosphorylase